ncbi:hypothetical protein Rsub_03830 [Raphidocelis subcapitata]|uniref:MAPEG family protein n=1 Tax=Raphidocelis subcapitata TaxID=307507 RepID=A0A2V0P1K9_9CHLO|nr:hypothetical protein Rsub_03830 [Raphidocelis subcapitata]|eukprot:GBF90975.1 hypothetical protein Rsub_03830 [Raphidocelis subcapitata]
MTAIEVEEGIFKGAALVTASYLVLFSATMVIQGLSRFGMERKALKAKKHFDRYTDPRMRPLDRAVGNLLEWLPVFLGLFWLSIALGADTVMLGWAYVIGRVFYCVLAYSGQGISRTVGAKAPILLATVPMYAVLGMLGREVFTRALA